MDQLAERRELYNGFGNALALGIEFALGPVIFGGLGWALDRWLGIAPILTVVLAVVGVVASFLRTWYRYDAEMREKEATAVWSRHGRTVMTPAGVGSASEQPARERSGFFAKRTDDTVMTTQGQR